MVELIKAQAAEITRLRAQLDDWRASQHYSYIGADGKPVKARDLEDAVIRLRANVEAADKLAMAITVETDKAGMDHAVSDALTAYKETEE